MAQTQNGVLQKDDNGYPVMGGTSSTDDNTVINSAFDPSTRRLLVDGTGGGGGGVNVETPVGTVDGSNNVFTVSHTPKFVVVDSSSYFETLHYTYSAPTITMNVLLAPTQFIRSIY